MNSVFLLIALTQQGYWLAGQDALLTVSWGQEVRAVDATFRWELQYGEISLLQGETNVSKEKPVALKIVAPKVRERTDMTLKWKLVSNNNREQIDSGEIAICIFPDDPMKNTLRRLGNRAVGVWSEDESFHDAMKKSGLRVKAVRKTGSLATLDADLIVVGPDTLGKDAMHHQPLIEHAKSGATVIIFRHTDREALLGLRLIDRQIGDNIQCRQNHPLLTGLTRSDVLSLLDAKSLVLRAEHEKATMPIVFAKDHEPEFKKDELMDSFYLVQSFGKGRLVFCQLPLDNWVVDPRSRQLLCNALEFVLVPGEKAASKVYKR